MLTDLGQLSLEHSISFQSTVFYLSFPENYWTLPLNIYRIPLVCSIFFKDAQYVHVGCSLSFFCIYHGIGWRYFSLAGCCWLLILYSCSSGSYLLGSIYKQDVHHTIATELGLSSPVMCSVIRKSSCQSLLYSLERRLPEKWALILLVSEVLSHSFDISQ